MGQVVSQILSCLFVATMFGVIIGWAARGLRNRNRAATETTAARRAVDEVRGQLRASESARATAQATVTELHAVADGVARERENLRRQLKETEMARDTARHDTTGTRDHLSKLSAELQEVASARDAARAESEASRTALASARTRVSEVEQQRDALRRENEVLHATHASVSAADEAAHQRLETLRATLQAAEGGWDSARAQAEAAFEQLAATRRQLAQSEVDRAALAAQLAENQAQLDGLRRRVPPEAPPPREDGLPTDTKATAAAKARSTPPRDDLQRIRGIGPVLERTLHRAGIERYAQIAAWTRDDIRTLSQRLPGIHDRIVRDRWPTAARRLHIAKYGSPP
jgi:predicted flap endonuclease-1-like 5' DNA nuclease